MKDRVAMRYLSGLTLVLLSLLIWRCDVALGCEATGDLLKHLRNSDEIERLVASEKLVNSCDDFDNLRKAVKTMWSFLDKEKCETPGSNPCQIKLNLILALRHCSEKDEEIFPEMLRRLISQSDKKIEPSLRAAAVDILVESVEGKGLASDRRFAQLFRLVSKRRMAWSSVLPVLEQAFQELFRVDTVKLDTSSGGTATEFTDQQAGHVQEFLRHALDGGCNKTEKQRERASTNFTEMLCRMFGETLGTLLTGPSGQSIASRMVDLSGNTPVLTSFGKAIKDSLNVAPLVQKLSSWLTSENIAPITKKGESSGSAEIRAGLLLALMQEKEKTPSRAEGSRETTGSSQQDAKAGDERTAGVTSKNLPDFPLSRLFSYCLLLSESELENCLKQLQPRLESKSIDHTQVFSGAIERLWVQTRGQKRRSAPAPRNDGSETEENEIEGLPVLRGMLRAFEAKPKLKRHARIAVWKVAEGHLRTEGWNSAMGWIENVASSQMEDISSSRDPEEMAAFQTAMSGLVRVLQADWVDSSAALHPQKAGPGNRQLGSRKEKGRFEVWGEAKKRSLKTLSNLCNQFPEPLIADESSSGFCVEALRRALQEVARRALQEVATHPRRRSIYPSHLENQDYQNLLSFVSQPNLELSAKEAWLIAGPLVQLVGNTDRPAQTLESEQRRILVKIFETLCKSDTEKAWEFTPECSEGLSATAPSEKWKQWWLQIAQKPPLFSRGNVP